MGNELEMHLKSQIKQQNKLFAPQTLTGFETLSELSPLPYTFLTKKCYVCATSTERNNIFKDIYHMKIGNKILKIRELKNISPKDMADRMDMSLSGYQKIERDDVDINIERLLQVAGIFEMKPEELLTFDEKMVFNNHAEVKSVIQGINNGTFNAFPEDMKRLYEENAKLYQDKIKLQEQVIKMLEEKVKGFEEK